MLTKMSCLTAAKAVILKKFLGYDASSVKLRVEIRAGTIKNLSVDGIILCEYIYGNIWCTALLK